MQSDALKIAKLERQKARDQQLLDLVGKLLDNPVIEMAAWIMVMEQVSKMVLTSEITGVQRIIQELGLPAVFTTGFGVIAAKQIAPAMPMIGQGISSMVPIAGLLAGA